MIFQHILQYRFGTWPNIWKMSFLKLSRPVTKKMFQWNRGIFQIQISIWLPYNQDTATASKNTVKSKETPAT